MDTPQMRTPKPERAEQMTALQVADKIHKDCVEIWEDDDGGIERVVYSVDDAADLIIAFAKHELAAVLTALAAANADIDLLTKELVQARRIIMERPSEEAREVQLLEALQDLYQKLDQYKHRASKPSWRELMRSHERAAKTITNSVAAKESADV